MQSTICRYLKIWTLESYRVAQQSELCGIAVGNDALNKIFRTET